MTFKVARGAVYFVLVVLGAIVTSTAVGEALTAYLPLH